jgi:hypothetical protein
MLRLSLPLSRQNGLRVRISSLKSPSSTSSTVHPSIFLYPSVLTSETPRASRMRAKPLARPSSSPVPPALRVYRPAILIWPFRTAVDPSTRLFQIINDERAIPEIYAVARKSHPHTKLLSERIVTAANKSNTAKDSCVLDLYVPVTPSTELEAITLSTISSRAMP